MILGSAVSDRGRGRRRWRERWIGRWRGGWKWRWRGRGRRRLKLAANAHTSPSLALPFSISFSSSLSLSLYLSISVKCQSWGTNDTASGKWQMKPKWTSHFNIQSETHTHSQVCCNAYALLYVHVYCIEAPPLGALAKAEHESEISGTFFKCRLQTTSRTRWFITHSTTSTSQWEREAERKRGERTQLCQFEVI